MPTPGSWITKAPTPSEKDPNVEELISKISKKLDLIVDEKRAKPRTLQTTSKEVSGTTRPSRPKKTRNSSRSNKGSSEVRQKNLEVAGHAIWKNKATGIFWCECGALKTHDERDAKYHINQNRPKQVKKPYIRKDHLTDRPLAHNSALRELRDSLDKNTKENN